MLTRLLITLFFIALPSVALAHPGPHAHPHADNALHPLLTLDHVIPMAGILLAAVFAYRWARSRN